MSESARWRAPVVVVCLVLVALLVPVAVVATWLRDMVSDTDRYVATVAADHPTGAWTAGLVLATAVALALLELVSLGAPSAAGAGDGT